MPSLESVVSNVTENTSFHSKGCSSSTSEPNNINTNVHTNESIRSQLSTLPAIQDECSFPDTQADTVGDLATYGTDLHRQAATSDVTNTSSVTSSFSAQTARTRCHRQSQSNPTSNVRRRHVSLPADRSNNVKRGPPETYVSLGAFDCICNHCKALFWYDERLKSGSRRSPEYKWLPSIKMLAVILRIFYIVS